MKAISAVAVVLIVANLGFGQVDEARDSIERGEYVRAVNILSAALGNQPTGDVYVYLGIAYGRMKEYQKAQDILKEGADRYPQDARFHNQLADLFLEKNDVDGAKSELRRALAVEPGNNYASDLLATIDMSQGEVQAALQAWNKTGRPIVNDILHNYYPTFGSWVVRDALAFHPAGVLRYDAWKTTESRLFETGNFSNVGIDIEPAPVPDQYNAVIRTTAKKNTLGSLAVGLVKGLLSETSYLDLWNIGNSGVNFNSNYRWDANRRRVEGRLKIPVPLPGLLHIELANTWRAERWDLSRSIRSEFRPSARFDYRANTVRFRVKQIPHYRVEVGAGLEYRNRSAKGDLPELFTDSSKVGRFSAETNLRLVDRRYQNRLHLEAFLSRRSILGDVNFTGGVVELSNRFTLSKTSSTYLDWTIKAGTARGRLPVEDYFVLGVDTTNPRHLLRGHKATEHDKYGKGPMGTDFALVNFDIERHLKTIPLFSALNIPFFTVKGKLFFDAAKTFDRNRIFQQGRLFLDTGAGLRFETPTSSFNIGYGRSLRDGKGVLFAYVERRLW